MVEEVDTVQLFEMKAKVLLLATVKGPVIYIGIGNPRLADGVAVALNVDRCITNDALLTSEKLTSITTFA